MGKAGRKRSVVAVAAVVAAVLLGWGGWSLVTQRSARQTAPPVAGRTIAPSPPPVPAPPIAPRKLGPGSARLSWDEPAPEPRLSRESLDRVAGYRIYVGPRPDALRLEAQLANPAATSYVVQRLPRGTAWFTVTTYTRLGIESDRPEPVSKEIH